MVCTLEKSKIMYFHNSKLYLFLPEKTAELVTRVQSIEHTVLLSLTALFSLLSDVKYGALTMAY